MVSQDWFQRNPQWNVPGTAIPASGGGGIGGGHGWSHQNLEFVSRSEFEALKRELESLKSFLAAAKKYDTETGQPDCEDAEKVALLKRLGELVGVDVTAALK